MNLPVVTHAALPVPHGFFGREGGASDGVYMSLNCGLGSNDDPKAVRHNRDTVRRHLGADALVSLYQVHSPDVLIIDEPPKDRPRADGVITRTAGLALSALSADCGPVLFCDPQAQIIAACHAGWRGALSGVIESTVAAMCEIGARPDAIRAVLGPCIGPDHYEVGEDFRDTFLNVSDQYATFFTDGPVGRPHFDLPTFILSRLQACGVGKSAWTGHCTYADPTRYFSYRRNTHEGLDGYGRNISAIMLPE
ncbi:MAG: peptidoglycan editing factor PgeF [Pseudomonadota bacterium]